MTDKAKLKTVFGEIGIPYKDDLVIPHTPVASFVPEQCDPYSSIALDKVYLVFNRNETYVGQLCGSFFRGANVRKQSNSDSHPD